MPPARALLQVNERSNPNDIRTLSTLGVLAARSGDRAEALRRIAQIEALRAGDLARRAYYQVATIYTVMGDRDRAFAALDDSFRQRAPFLWRVRVDPEFDALRDDRRMALLLEKLSL